MAYDELLAMRMRDALGTQRGITEKRMMGGICFFVSGNMICGADRAKNGSQRFMFRLGKEDTAGAKLPDGTQVVMGGRPMRGFYFVDAGTCDRKLLGRWLKLALAHAKSLPPK